jgi:hypothetical protein
MKLNAKKIANWPCLVLHYASDSVFNHRNCLLVGLDRYCVAMEKLGTKADRDEDV